MTVTFTDILRAQQRIRPYLPRTPLHRYTALDTLLDAEVYVKHENYEVAPGCVQSSLIKQFAISKEGISHSRLVD